MSLPAVQVSYQVPGTATRADLCQPPLFYDHAHRLRLEKLFYLHLEPPRSPNGNFKPVPDPGGGLNSETAVTWPFRK
jgi:hypothetical protein